MRNSRLFVWLALAAGMVLPGASTLSAQDRRGVPANVQARAELRTDYRDIVRDRIQLDRLRTEVARDQARLQEAIRRGRSREAARFAAELARDQQAMRDLMRHMGIDRRDTAYDRSLDAGRDYRDSRDPRYANR